MGFQPLRQCLLSTVSGLTHPRNTSFGPGNFTDSTCLHSLILLLSQAFSTLFIGPLPLFQEFCLLLVSPGCCHLTLRTVGPRAGGGSDRGSWGGRTFFSCCAKLQPCPGLDLVVLGGRKGLGELLAAEVRVFVLGGCSAQKAFFPRLSWKLACCLCNLH